MSDKLTPEITPQLAISAFAVLHQYCPECFTGCPGDQGETIRKLQSNE